MTSVDLNADIGESFGRYTLPGEDELLTLITSANVACGFHAADPQVMQRTVSAATGRGVTIGAHPSYPDRVGFGRRELSASPAEIAADVTYQVGALDAFCRAAGTRVRYVKLHGALYHRAARDRDVAKAVAFALRQLDSDLIVLCLEGSALLQAAAETGLDVAREAFVDRAYQPDGQLVPRGMPGAVLEDVAAIAERALRMVQDKHVVAVDGTRCMVRADSLCVHGDGAKAVEIVRAVRQRFEAGGISLAPFVK
ncbi:MAG TPA: 5-oxoprolinase subunit PxpA [Gemmatimonadales bacterium]|nr:5-oxoprolinase subunit PxpA [Gemmatimonadales bacterium]